MADSLEVQRTESIIIHWEDAERRVLHFTGVKRLQRWEEVYSMMAAMNDAIRSVPHGVYSIVHFATPGTIWPQNRSIPNLRNLIVDSPSNELLVVLVNTGKLLETLVHSINKVYSLEKFVGKYRFVSTLEQAHKLIEAHRQEHS